MMLKSTTLTLSFSIHFVFLYPYIHRKYTRIGFSTLVFSETYIIWLLVAVNVSNLHTNTYSLNATANGIYIYIHAKRFANIALENAETELEILPRYGMVCTSSHKYADKITNGCQYETRTYIHAHTHLAHSHSLSLSHTYR